MQILIAEDQASSAFYLRRILEKMGHTVRVATDGGEAWEMLCAERSPVVISDWMMPRMDGIELCRRIRSRRDEAYTYIILLTSKQEHADRLAGLRAGADDFLVKPPDAAELAIRLEIAARILSVQEELEKRNVQLARLAEVDELTGVKNRRFFLEALTRQFAQARQDNRSLSLIMIDVDFFKSFNDTYGHPAGDEVLRQVASLLSENVRTDDVVARIGGEEFAAILPGLEAAESRTLSERLGRALASYPWPLRLVTASQGIATLNSLTSKPSQLIEEADRALYASKGRGRDRVTHFQDLVIEATARAV